MFYLSYWQDTVVLALLGAGTLLALGMALTYMDLWRPRAGTGGETDAEPARETLVMWFLSHVSWILVAISAGAGIWGLLYALEKIAHPPNW